MVVIMPNTEVNSALEIAETIRVSLAKSELKQKDNGQSIGKVTVSIGVTALQAADDVESFVARADKALYAAKTGGRNKVMQA
jgi:diguanylate cyclase